MRIVAAGTGGARNQEPIMSESTHGSSPSPSTNPNRGGRRRFFSGLAIGGVIGALLGGAASAWSHAEGPGGWHGRGWCHGSARDPGAERERIAFATDWMLQRIDATPEQREQVKGIVANVLQDLAPLREQHRQNRDAFLTALAQPQVDRATLEQLRRAELELADQASNRIIGGLADVSGVLTPEQRAKLLEMAERFKR
jgi:Spy/CpxP family protein refolding chaperone